MPEVTLVIGSDAYCADGARGEVKSLVVDPGPRAVTHLVVEPGGRRGLARLVPLDHVEAGAGRVVLRYTEPEFMDLTPAEETVAEFVPGYEAPIQMLAPGWAGTDVPAVDGGTVPVAREMEDVDIVPDVLPGEDEEHRGDRVRATDGDVGRLLGLSVEPGTGRITRLLLREGHIWGRREVSIPGDVVRFGRDGISLTVSRRQAEEL
jgi:hypothetical protein